MVRKGLDVRCLSSSPLKDRPQTDKTLVLQTPCSGHDPSLSTYMCASFSFPFPKYSSQNLPCLETMWVSKTTKRGQIQFPPEKAHSKKKEELDINEAENDTQVTKYSLIWGCRHLKLNNCLIPVINTLLHKPGRLYF